MIVLRRISTVKFTSFTAFRSDSRLLSDISADKSKPLQITSPVFYVNAVPHIGHLYSAVIADTLKRWYEFKGHTTIYSTGTDEHGLKIQEAAKKANADPKDFCDKISEKFKILFDSANISYTRFIRTTDSDHYLAKTLVEKGFIYKGNHEGWYSISDETFYPATQVESQVDQKTGKTIVISKESGKVVEWTAEENYKFKLELVREKLIQWLQENPEAIIPKAQYNNIMNSLTSTDNALSDISVSRPTTRLKWGIPVPGDPSHVIYVWLDALTNYLTVAGYPWPSNDDNTLAASSWPARWHIVGKDIIKFHAIYWPAFLIAAGLPPPTQILSHAHWLQNKSKMSKSLGNVTDPHQLIKQFGVDPVRYFLIRDGGIEHDVDFSEEMVLKRYRELGNQLGNLALRCSGAKVNAKQSIPIGLGASGISGDEEILVKMLNSVRDEATLRIESGQFGRGLESVINVLSEANRYWDHQKPWILASKSLNGDLQAREKLQTALYMCFETVRVSSLLLQPVMPNKMGILLDWMKVKIADRIWDKAVFNTSHRVSAVGLNKLEALFPKL
ncbi:methionyl-tRNA synthetase [Physocladia obscura]|uniref:Methionine--tRNA ligase, mitochondrial n=1 Tax=Physocladia obscura TaxID=109957 RepID=A0AAD5XBK4_9FUNG|nr:methionyl-tRNA synthetase [Physocladia obscura]